MTQGGGFLLQDSDWRRRNSMWLVPTVVCCGTMTWASFLYVGVRAKRSDWLAAAAIYGVTFAAYFALVGTSPKSPDGSTGASSWQSTAGSIFLLAVWIGGSVHALIINRQWLAFLASPQDPTPTPWFAAKDPTQPATLDDPWRSFVAQSLNWQREIVTAVDKNPPGPVKDRLQVLADHVRTGVTECRQLAQEGQQLVQARAHINTSAATQELARLQTLGADPSLTQAAQAFQAQLDTATRIDGAISSTYNGLVLSNARLGEVAARVIELGTRSDELNDVAEVETVVESVVDELVAIRQALTELDG